MALAALCALRAWGAEPLRSPLMIAALLFWANAGGSVLWSPAPLASFVAVCTFSLLPLGMTAFSRAPEDFYRFCMWGAGIVLAGMAALAQHFIFTDMLVFGQVRWPFANPNSYAALLSLGFFPALGMMVVAGHKKSANALAVFCALLLSAIGVIGGRGVLLALILLLVFFICMNRSEIRRRWSRLSFVVLVAAMVFFIAGLNSAAHHPPAARMMQLAADTGGITGERAAIWRAAAAMIRDHVPFGAGFGTFYLYYPQYRLPAEIYSGGYMAHSDPLQFAAEAGLAAPLLFYAFLLFAALRMMRVRRDSLTWAAFCGFAAMVAHTHIDFNLYTPSILALSAPLLGWWLRQTAPENTAPAPMDNIRFATLALPVLAALFVLQGFLRSEYHAGAARKQMIAGDMAAFAAEVEKSNRAGWGWNARPYIMAAVVPVGILEAGAAVNEKDALAKKAGFLLTRAAENNARSAAVPYMRARLALATDDSDAAREYFRRALALVPQHLSARMELADMLPEDAAYDLLKDGLQWRYAGHDPSAFYARLAVLAAARGDSKTAADALSKGAAAKRRGTQAEVLPFTEEGSAAQGF